MDLNLLEDYGLKCIQFLKDYHFNIRNLKVIPNSQPGTVYKDAIGSFKEDGEDFDVIWQQFQDVIVPNLVHWQHPNFLAFYPANISAESVLGELLSAGLGVQAMYWFTSPAAQELEIAVTNILCQILKLPEQFHSKNSGAGALNSSSSESAALVLSAARERQKQKGHSHNDVVCKGTVYVSDQTHASIHRAFLLCGFNPQNWRVVKTAANDTMEVEELLISIKKDLQLGLIPLMAVGTIGTTNSCAIDNISSIGDLCEEFDFWFHVDAAYALAAAVCPEYSWITKGLEKSTSIAFNCHKWLLTNFDCSVLWVCEKKMLNVASSPMVILEHHQDQAFEELFDLREFQFALGRRFRSLKLYFVLRSQGISGLQSHIRKDICLAADLKQFITKYPNVEIKSCSMGVVLFRVKNEPVTRKIHSQLEAHGYFTNGIELKNNYWIRICFSSVNAKNADGLKLAALLAQLFTSTE